MREKSSPPYPQGYAGRGGNDTKALSEFRVHRWPPRGSGYCKEPITMHAATNTVHIRWYKK